MVNLEGSYKIYLDGNLVSDSKNIITDIGKSVIRKFLAGTYPNWAYGLGIGVGTGSTTTAATVSDIKLQYEIERQPIIYKSTYTSGTDEYILLKAQYSNSLAAVIKEVGVFPSVWTSSNGLYNDRILTDFSETEWSGGYDNVESISSMTYTSTTATFTTSANHYFATGDTVVIAGMTPTGYNGSYTITGITSNTFTVANTTNAAATVFGTAYRSNTASLIGSESLVFTSASSSATLAGLAIGMDGYSSVDKLSLLVTNNNASAKTITVTLTGTNAATKSYAFSIANTATTQIVELALSDGPSIISTLASITVASSTLTSGQSITLDGLKIVNYDEYGPTADMVSRSVLATPITKTVGQELEVEYSLKVS